MVLEGRDMGGISHFWSLSVEEHFYMVAPLLMLKLSSRALGIVCLGVWIACAASRAKLGHGYEAVAQLSPFQFDCLLFGIAAAVLHAEGSFLGVSRRTAARLALVSAVLAVPLLLGRQASNPTVFVVAQTFEQLFFSWATAGAILYLWTTHDSWAARFLSLRPFVYLGKISYGLYVWHFPVLLVSSVLLSQIVSRGSSLVALGLTIAVAALSFHLFERPVSNLKRHFSYRRG
jgi:peptidoglycan/LPS O-acetylase OafA/YrhL